MILRGKRAVITGGGRGFGRALAVWLARKAWKWIFARAGMKIYVKLPGLLLRKGGTARGYICDLSQPESVSQFSAQLLQCDKAIDIFIINAAQWLSGPADGQPSIEVINTISSGLTASILLTQALLPGLRRSECADIVSIISACGIPNFTHSAAHPAFFASKHGLSGYTTKLSELLAKENIRVTGLYPPDFETTGLNEPLDYQPVMGTSLLNGRSVWETIRFVLTQPRSCHISTIYFQGPTREDLACR